MAQSNPTITVYQKHYSDITFERAGLFSLIRENYPCTEVLYPGSFVHITPSFFFPHVVYVDQDPVAGRFFADSSTIRQYIDRNKLYKRSAYVRFIAQDYTEKLDLRAGQFDLLLSLFAGNVSQSCKRYLKAGGILVTNNFQGDARQAAADHEFQMIAVVSYQAKKYSLLQDPVVERFMPGRAKRKPYTRQVSRGIEYVEDEDYFVFRKV